MNDNLQIRIALADDHTMVRENLVDMLNRKNGFSVVAQAPEGISLRDELLKLDAPPDVCILDVNMPKGGGHAAISVLKESFPEMGFVILSMLDHQALILKMFRAGALAYVTKDASSEVLCQAIRSAAAGRYCFPGDAGNTILSQLQSGSARERAQKLTPKEEEFLRWCLHPEMGYKHIADAMGVTERTVNGYRESIFLKMDINSRSGLLLTALQLGLNKL